MQNANAKCYNTLCMSFQEFIDEGLNAFIEAFHKPCISFGL